MKRQLLPLTERENLTLAETAAQFAVNPEVLRRDIKRYAPHAWQTPFGGRWRVPRCCVSAHGREHPEQCSLLPGWEPFSIIASNEPEEAHA